MNGSITTVFIIDDDAAVRESLALLLEQEGLTVNAFDSAESFLSYCQPVLSTCLNECNGCIVCDINMPGMDGMEFHQVLKERSILLPIIFNREWQHSDECACHQGRRRRFSDQTGFS